MIHLRPANPKDASAIAAILIAARRKAMPYLPRLHSEGETRDWVANTVLPEQIIWVVEVKGRAVGYAAVKGSMQNDLYVHPEAQGAGVGSALLGKAQELSSGELDLWTFQRNERARRFYEHRGFHAVEFGDGSGNEEGEPDVRYRWTTASDSTVVK